MNRSLGKGRKRNRGCGCVPLGEPWGGEEGVLLLQVEGPGAECSFMDTGGNAGAPGATEWGSSSLLVLCLTHPRLSFALFIAGGGSMEISLLRSSSAVEGMQWRIKDLNPGHV